MRSRIGRVAVAVCVLAALVPLVAGEAAASHGGDAVYVRSVDGVTFANPVNISNDSAATGIARVAAASGAVHVAWDDVAQPREVRTRRSPDDGLSFGPTRNISSNAGDSSENEVAAWGSTVLYVFEEDVLNANGTVDASRPGDEANARYSADAGVTVNPPPSQNPINVSSTPDGHSRDPVAAGGPTVAAVAHEDDDSGNDEILVETSTTGGASWSTPTNVSGDPGQSAEPGLAVTGSTIHTVWEDRDDGSLGYARSTNAGGIWSSPTNLPGAFSRAGVIAAAGNTVHVMGCAPNGGDVVYLRSTNGGVAWSGGTTIGDGCGKPKVAVDGSDVYAVWEDGTVGNTDVMYAHSADAGQTWSPVRNLSANSGQSSEPAVAVDPSTGTVHVVWTDLSEPPPPPPPPPGSTTTTTAPPPTTTSTTTTPPTTSTTTAPPTSTTAPPTSTTAPPTSTTAPPTSTTTTAPPPTTTIASTTTTAPPPTTTIASTTTTAPPATTTTTAPPPTTTTAPPATAGLLRHARSVDGGSSFASRGLTVPPSATGASSVTAADGVVNVAFDATSSPSEVWRLRSTDDGTSFGGPVNLSLTPAASAHAEVAGSGSSVVAVWEEVQASQSGSDVVARRSTDAGANFSPVPPSAPINISATPGTHSRDPSLAAGPGLYVVAYEEAVGGNDEIMLRRSTDGGATWSAPVNVSQDLAQSAQPDVTIIGGVVHVAWEDRGSDGVAYARSTDGGATFPPSTVLALDVSREPALAASGAGLYVVGCRGIGGKLLSSRSADGGATWSGPTSLGRGCRGPVVAASGQAVHVAWLDSSQGSGDVQYRRSTNAASSFGSPTNLSASSAPSTAPSLAVDPVTGTVHLTWYEIDGGPPPPVTTTTTMPTTTTTAPPSTTTTTRASTTTTAPPGPCTIRGTAGFDMLRGTPGDDVLCGLGGNDVIFGDGGDDVVDGGDGDDLLIGAGGGDELLGGPGNDRIEARDGFGGNDVADGGPGTDICRSDPGDTVVSCR